ncbi:vacuolar iron family transporter [Perkinsela sp. CCAP 1560/4]|nr:vacuolar iron family transporter [Perkinsela sp. CCAP 1560/4]|eukprot:KNH08201.1 vacuolar iron family transporter [Perkinsela sp. CCAP 1560/4]
MEKHRWLVRSIWYPSVGMLYVKRHSVTTTMDAVKDLVKPLSSKISMSSKFPSSRQIDLEGIDFLCYSAESQTTGRGTQGSTWCSPPGNLHFTVAVRSSTVENCKLSDGLRLFPVVTSLCTLASTKHALRRFMSMNCSHLNNMELQVCLQKMKLKWPNDLVYEQKKIAGVLIEQFGDWFLIGVGVNILKSPRILDSGRTASSFLRIGNLRAPHVKIDMEPFRRNYVKDFVGRLRAVLEFPEERNRRTTYANPTEMLRVYEKSLANDLVYQERTGKRKYIPLRIDNEGALVAREHGTNNIRTFSSTYLY